MRSVVLSPEAREDISRLITFLAVNDHGAAARLRTTLGAALESLREFPERGPCAPDNPTLRELKVRFGRYGYFVQYQVGDREVFVSNIFHAREQR